MYAFCGRACFLSLFFVSFCPADKRFRLCFYTQMLPRKKGTVPFLRKHLAESVHREFVRSTYFLGLQFGCLFLLIGACANRKTVVNYYA